MPINLIAAAVVAVGIVVAAMFGRYEIQVHTGGSIKQTVVYRADRLSGDVETCFPVYASLDEPTNIEKQPGWCKADLLPNKNSN